MRDYEYYFMVIEKNHAVLINTINIIPRII